MKLMGKLNALELTLGDCPSDSFCCTILVSKDIVKLEEASDKLVYAINKGFEDTAKFFKDINMAMPVENKEHFEEMYRGSLFETSIYVVGEV